MSRDLTVRIKAEVSGLLNGLRTARSEIAGFDTHTKKSTNSLKQFLGVSAGATVALGLGKMIRDSVTLEAAYSKTMAQVAVATGAPKSALKELDALALKMGKDTIFSAQDSAQAMLELAKGGLSVATIKAGALADTLTLASAGGMDLGTAANTVVNAMGAFQLKATQTTAAVAALAGAANASSSDVSDVAMALSQVGTTAHSAGLSIQQTTAYIALLSNQGIKGSDAGTSLRTMFTRLVPQTKQAKAAMQSLGLTYLDHNHNLVSAEQIAARTQKAFKGLSDQQRISAVNAIFGQDAQRAVNAITSEGVDGLKKYEKSTNDLTQAQKLAKAANSGTSGAIENLKGSIETAEIQLGKGLAPTVQKFATQMNQFVSSGDFEKWGHNVGAALSAVGSQLSTIAGYIKPVVKGFDALPAAGKKAILMGAGVAILATKMGLLDAAALKATTSTKAADIAAAKAARSQALLRGGALLAGGALLSMSGDAHDAGRAAGVLNDTLAGAAIGFGVGGPWGAAVGGAIGLIKGFGQKQHDAIGDVSGLTSTLDTQTGAITKNTRAWVTNSLNTKPKGGGQSAFQLGKGLGLSPGMVTDAALGNAKAMKEVMTAISVVLQNENPLTDQAAKDALKLADAMGITKKQLAAAAEQWKNHNDAVKGSLELNKLSAKQVADLGKAVKGVPKKVLTQFTQPGYKNATQNATDIARKYKLTPKQVSTVLEALNYTKPQIAAVLAAMKTLDGKVANPKIDVTSNAKSAAQAAQQWMNSVHGVTKYISVRTASAQADGGLYQYANGGIRAFANGAENHTAQIAPAGSMRLWAEPETGGEAYIPLAMSKRSRSLQIWAQTGKALGVAGFSDGGGTPSGGSSGGYVPVRITDWERGLGVIDDRSRNIAISVVAGDRQHAAAGSRRKK